MNIITGWDLFLNLQIWLTSDSSASWKGDYGLEVPSNSSSVKPVLTSLTGIVKASKLAQSVMDSY